MLFPAVHEYFLDTTQPYLVLEQELMDVRLLNPHAYRGNFTSHVTPTQLAMPDLLSSSDTES